MVKAVMQKGETMDNLISTLSEIRSEYNCLDEAEEPYYRALSEAIEALSAQPETHEKRTETHACDCISRQDAIDVLSLGKEILSRVLEDIDVVGIDREKYSFGLGLIESNINDIEELPSAQSEPTADAEFWRKRADYYSDMCSKLIADMGAGVKIEAVKIDETGITFTKKKPSAQPEIIACGDCKHWICHERLCGYWNHGVKPLMWCSQAERREE